MTTQVMRIQATMRRRMKDTASKKQADAKGKLVKDDEEEDEDSSDDSSDTSDDDDDSDSDESSDDEEDEEEPSVKKLKNKIEDNKKEEVSIVNDHKKSQYQKRKLEEDEEDNGHAYKKTATGVVTKSGKSTLIDGTEENTKLFIRGLPWKASQDEVHDFFSSCGEIKSIELPLMDDGRSSGTDTCFIQRNFKRKADEQSMLCNFSTNETSINISHHDYQFSLYVAAIIEFAIKEGGEACFALNGNDFNGRCLNIKYSNAKPILAPREPSAKPDGCVTVFVGNLSFNVDEETLRETFKDCGEITSIRFAADKATGEFKGFDHIEFASTESTDAAIKMSGTDILGRAVRVDYANDRRNGRDGGFGGSPRGNKFGGCGDFGRGGGRGRGGRGDFGGRGGRGSDDRFGGGRGGRGGSFGGRGKRKKGDKRRW